MSYGRSSVVFTLVALGLVLRVHRELQSAESGVEQRSRKRRGTA